MVPHTKSLCRWCKLKAVLIVHSTEFGSGMGVVEDTVLAVLVCFLEAANPGFRAAFFEAFVGGWKGQSCEAQG